MPTQGEQMTDLVDRLRSADISGHGLYSSLVREAADEIERLRAALAECSADFAGPPCTIPEGFRIVSVEFQRRMHVAAAALVRTEDEHERKRDADAG